MSILFQAYTALTNIVAVQAGDVEIMGGRGGHRQNLVILLAHLYTQGVTYVLIFKAHGPPFPRTLLPELYEFTGPSVCSRHPNSTYLV